MGELTFRREIEINAGDSIAPDKERQHQRRQCRVHHHLSVHSPTARRLSVLPDERVDLE